ncbi:hypothetical protein ACQEU3_37605 [Spirillospora sp. CA-253888]
MAETIRISGRRKQAATLQLAPEQRLVGEGPGAALEFVGGVDGVQLSRGNTIEGLTVLVDRGRRAIFSDVADLGHLRLAQVSTVGQVQLLAGAGQVTVDRLHVVDADVRVRTKLSRPPWSQNLQAFQGAFTLWQRQGEELSLRARLTRISVGQVAAPVSGGGVLVAGPPGRIMGVQVEELSTGPVFADGGRPAGADTIGAGVLVAPGALVTVISHQGRVDVRGDGDKALVNWGIVGTWRLGAPISSHGVDGEVLDNSGMIGSIQTDGPLVSITMRSGGHVYVFNG